MEDAEIMTASEPAARQMSPFDRVISYLHANNLSIDTKRAVYRQLQLEVADENLGYLKRRLKEFAKLEVGWDGEDALPTDKKIIVNVDDIFRTCKSNDLADWSVFPNVNGTILLQRKHAVISIGEEAFSYFANSGNEEIEGEQIPFSIPKVIKVIKEINSYA